MTHRKIFFLSLFTILIIFSALSFSSEIKREDLFSKAGIQAIKSGKKAPNFRLEDLKGKKVGVETF